MNEQKPKARRKRGEKYTSLRCTINGAHFDASGPPEEVQAKFKAFLDETFGEIRKVLNAVLPKQSS